MWWFAAIHANLLMLYRRTISARTGARPLLDAGCGTGGLLARLRERFPAVRAIGLDADGRPACGRRTKSARPVCAGSVNALPFADARVRAIVSADVLCHRGVDERSALAQFHRCLAAGGVLILNLPAYRWMLSRHDAAVYNARRYTRHEVLAAAARRRVPPALRELLEHAAVSADGGDAQAVAGRREPQRRARCIRRWSRRLCRAATAIERGLLRARDPAAVRRLGARRRRQSRDRPCLISDHSRRAARAVDRHPGL